MDIQQIFGTVIMILLLVYVSFMVTQQFCEMTPSYCGTGWVIFGALVFGVIVFLKYALFPSR